ncbi:MAG: hypothetical protein H6673_11010 [Anaerolineales bacterium]|nr:hypothetical protein [Anaerolineales bacterium]
MQNKVLQTAWKRWTIIQHEVGDFHARAITILFYFTVLVPFALGVRLFTDPLNIKTPKPTWGNRSPISTALDDARRQS